MKNENEMNKGRETAVEYQRPEMKIFNVKCRKILAQSTIGNNPYFQEEEESW